MKNARGKQSRKGFYLALLGVGVAGLAAILWATQRDPNAGVVTLPTAPAVAADVPGYVRGDSAAPVEIVEYADFECPGCGQFATVTEPDVIKRLVETGQARYRVYLFPVNGSHRNSPAASLAAACADEQGKFWEMHDRIFAGQNEWNSFATDNPKSVLRGYAQAVGVDLTSWDQCYDGRKYVDRVAAHAQAAERAQVRSTPTFIVGNRQVQGAQPFDVIKALVDSARATAGAAAPATPAPAAPAGQ
ncbi:thioredoxin domain-containing protein [Roseisolibacter sp. H3M3-2]|uniref:DsbA family protein n=1 Tax=Roseisolibacter sp. H3M3-2 TaxID=3031323 RepID=UPI0023D9CC97|nr:thioredoxin domain-containing protein [Roseisolibacter sp. H3M3-2]MDF1502453.1 thioredoxin domain-containing protein [Roseisolibacter sp. H3M3-2]